MTAINEIVRFQTDRELDKKKYDPINEHVNIVEELFESVGGDLPKESRGAFRDAWIDVTDYTGELGEIVDYAGTSKDMEVDAYCDVIVFAIGALLKLGYDPEKALTETAKEINSRKGEMVDGKFEKFTSTAAKELWYKANYDICKR